MSPQNKNTKKWEITKSIKLFSLPEFGQYFRIWIVLQYATGKLSWFKIFWSICDLKEVPTYSYTRSQKEISTFFLYLHEHNKTGINILRPLAGAIKIDRASGKGCLRQANIRWWFLKTIWQKHLFPNACICTPHVFRSSAGKKEERTGQDLQMLVQHTLRAVLGTPCAALFWSTSLSIFRYFKTISKLSVNQELLTWPQRCHGGSWVVGVECICYKRAVIVRELNKWRVKLHLQMRLLEKHRVFRYTLSFASYKSFILLMTIRRHITSRKTVGESYQKLLWCSFC